jgi:hypothetical protein
VDDIPVGPEEFERVLAAAERHALIATALQPGSRWPAIQLLAALDDEHLDALARAWGHDMGAAINGGRSGVILPQEAADAGRILQALPAEPELLARAFQSWPLLTVPGIADLGPDELERLVRSVEPAEVSSRLPLGGLEKRMYVPSLLAVAHARAGDPEGMMAALRSDPAAADEIRQAEDLIAELGLGQGQEFVSVGGDRWRDPAMLAMLDAFVRADPARRREAALAAWYEHRGLDPDIVAHNRAQIDALDEEIRRGSADAATRIVRRLIIGIFEEQRQPLPESLLGRPGLVPDARELIEAGLPPGRAMAILLTPGAMDRWRKLGDLPPAERKEAAVLVGRLGEAYDAARASGADHLTAWRRALGIPDHLPEVAPSEPLASAALPISETSQARGLWGTDAPTGLPVGMEPAPFLKASVSGDLAAMLPAELREAFRVLVGLAVPARGEGYGVAAKTLPEATSRIIATWAATANDDHPVSLAMQLRAQSLFGLKDAAHWAPRNDLAAEWIFEVDRMLGPLLDVFLADMYASTQAAFRRAGVREVTAYRGWHWPEDGVAPDWAGSPDDRAVPHRPLASYSARLSVAKRFAGGRGALTEARIPAERILAVPRTGFGCLGEAELVVLGGALEVAVDPVS